MSDAEAWPGIRQKHAAALDGHGHLDGGGGAAGERGARLTLIFTEASRNAAGERTAREREPARV